MKNSLIGDLGPVTLPQPVFKGCSTVFEALKLRRTSRELTEKRIPLQILADILWAAQGINREQGPFGNPGRTAASASNAQEIRVYVALAEGTYLYSPEYHRLAPVAAGDNRSLAVGAGQASVGANAPVRLIYVVDLEKFRMTGYPEPGLFDPEIQKSYYFVDTGLIAQNVFLAATCLGLTAWFHNCNKEALQKELELKPHERALFGQTLGYTEP